MMRIDDLVERIAALQRSDLEAWIGEGLVSPQEEAGTLLFSDMECARIDVPTISGPVTMSIPKGSNTGKTLRLRDKGIRNRKTGQRGHQLVTLKVVLPVGDEPELTAFLEAWQPTNPDDPRKEMLS